MGLCDGDERVRESRSSLFPVGEFDIDGEGCGASVEALSDSAEISVRDCEAREESPPFSVEESDVVLGEDGASLECVPVSNDESVALAGVCGAREKYPSPSVESGVGLDGREA